MFLVQNNKIIAHNSRVILNLDPMARTFFNTSGITNRNIIMPVNSFAVDMRAANLLSKLIAVYLFVGGTAALHKLNFINPADADSAFRMVWNGTVTHDANGVTGDGSTGYGNTHIVPATHLTVNNTSICIYIRTNTGTDKFDCGINQNLGEGYTRAFDLSSRFAGNLLSRQGNLSLSAFKANANASGFYIASRTASNNFFIRRNEETIASNTTTNSGALPTLPLSFMCLSSTSLFSPRQYAFLAIGSSVSTSESIILHRIVEKLQTGLGRNV